MPEPDYKKQEFPFDHVGVALASPVDACPDGLAPILENWRPEIDGTLGVRPGQGTGREVVAGQSPVHSVLRLDDSSSGTLLSTEIVGTGTHLATCATDLSASASVESGFSGDPLAMVKHKPVGSLKEWAYVADRTKLRKVDQAGNDKRIGLAAPLHPPTPKLDVPKYKVVEECNAAASWTQGGTAAAPTNNTRIDGATRTVTRFVWDTGTTGWACVRPSSLADVGVGTRVTVDAGGSLETVTVEEVFRGSSTNTTIASIIYQTGAGTGVASIHLTTPFLDIQPNSLIFIDDGAGTTEYARVLAVHSTPEGLTSIVVSLANTFTAAHTVTTYPSFRAYFTITHAAGVAMSAAGVEFVATVGKGWIDRTLAIDLSSIASGVPTQPDDLMHLDLFADDPTVINEVRVMLDVDVATNDFTKNYLLYAVRPNDLTPVAALEQTVLSNRQVQEQRDIIEGNRRTGSDNLTNARTEFGIRLGENIDPDVQKLVDNENRKILVDHISAGDNQWGSVTFRISELLSTFGRVGNDTSRGLANIAKLRILVWCTASVTIRVDSWWIGGGYGPEVGLADRPLIYRYRGKDSTTGVVGNFSPASRVSVRPNRQRVLVSADVQPDAECDTLEFERYGGSLLGWYYVGSTPNSGTPVFSDEISPNDLSALRVLSEGNTHYELWPILGLPNSGTSCNVSGALVQLLGFGQISTSMAPGAGIRINGKEYTVAEIIDADTFWLAQSAGAQTAVPWEIPEPTLIAQKLPILAGPYYGFYFASGDLLNAGRVYYSNGNDCDTTRDDHYFDIPGENVQAIAIVAERAIVFGVRGNYVIDPTFSLADSGGNLFRAVQVPTTEPIFSRWAWCSTGESIIYLGRSGGLCETDGAGARLLSSDLRPLFPHEGSAGIAVNGFQPPNVVAAQVANLRLSFMAGEVAFDYIDTSSGRRTLVWNRQLGDKVGWRPYVYSAGAQCHYTESGQQVNSVLLGGTDGKLYRLGRASADAAGASITATLRTPSRNLGDATNQKILNELRMSYDTDGTTITVIPGINNHATALATTSLTDAAGRKQKTIDISSGVGQAFLNVSLNVAVTVTTARPTLYFWVAVWELRSDLTLLRSPDYRPGPHAVNYVRGVYILADTFNVSRSALLEYVTDAGAVASVAITGIDHDVLCRRYYPLATPVYAVAHRVRPTDAGAWQFMGYDLDADPAPPLTTGQTEKMELGGARFVHGLIVDIDTANANVDLTVKGDQDATLATISSGNNSGPALANGRAQLAFSFEVPFITHLLYLTRSAACRIWGVKVLDNPEPELAYMWRTQQTDCGMPGWKIFGDGMLACRSDEDVELYLVVDGTSHQVTFYDATTDTALARRRLRFRCPPVKGKSVEFQGNTVTEAGRMAVYLADFSLEVKEWGYEGGWQMVHPFGAEHHTTGAPI